MLKAMPQSPRRKFIKKVGLLSSATILSPYYSCGLPSSKASSKITSSKKLGIALVGLGSYSTGQLAPALQLTKHCELRGIVTGSPEKIPVWQEKYDIPESGVYTYDTMHEIAENDDIDVVYIVVPTGLHMKYAIKAAEAGKHVWCEKPMAIDVTQCQAIINACAKNQVRLSIGYRMLHEPNMQEVIKLTKDQTFGKVQAMFAAAGYSGGVGTGWRYQKALGGGALYDMGVYTINALRHASQMEPISVLSAKVSTTRPEAFHEVDETTEYILEFPNGIKASGKTSVGENVNILQVSCEDGSYMLSPMQSYNGVKGERSDGVKIFTPIENQQAKQMDDDALAILNNQDFIATGEDGLKDVRIINAIQRSAVTGERVVIG